LSAPAATIYGWNRHDWCSKPKPTSTAGISRRLRRHFSVCRPNLAATSRRFAPSCAHSRVAPTGRRWLRLVRLLEKRDGVAPQLAQEIRLKAHQENVRHLRGDPGQLLEYLRQLPARENSPRLAIPLAEALIEHGAHDQAQRLIEGQLSVQWDPAWISLYGQLRGHDLIARIARAEAWLLEHPRDPRLLHALGRLCLSQGLWGKAQGYLEASLMAEQREARLELARLLEQTERSGEALPHYRAAAEQPA
jgi:HemY protein